MSPKSVYRSSSRKPIRLSQAGRGGARPDRRRGARKHRRSAVQDALVRACRPAASGLISAAMRRASAPATTPTPRPPQISRSARGTDAANHSRVSSLEASFGLAPGCSVSCLSIIGWDGAVSSSPSSVALSCVLSRSRSSGSATQRRTAGAPRSPYPLCRFGARFRRGSP